MSCFDAVAAIAEQSAIEEIEKIKSPHLELMVRIR